jgi:hypothetical protein
MRLVKQIFLGVIATASIAAAQANLKFSDDEAMGNRAIAERYALTAQTLLSTKAIVPATLRESAALLEAANKLAPDEPRFLRLLTEAYLQIGGDKGAAGAISALTRYRALEPDDQVAQIRLIDLYYSQQQSASECKKYIDQLLSSGSLSAEVNAHVLVLAAKLANEQLNGDKAKDYVKQALDLFPLSPEALKLEYQQLDASATTAERVAVLVQMLRSNPVQPGAMTELAADAASVGLVDPSLIWYQNALSLTRRMGYSLDAQQMTAYAAELVVADQLRLADSFLQALLQQNASNSDAAMLELLIAKRGGVADKIQAATDQARTALQGRLIRIGDSLNDRKSTTQPSTPLDISGDLKKLTAANNSDLTASYAAGLADLAWLEIYFNNKPADAQQYIAPLRQLLAGDSVTLTRLEGWSYLIDGKKDEAKVKLSAVADRDPFSGLGMIRIETSELPAERVTVAARRLLAKNPTGLIGAMLIEALRDRVSIMPQSETAAAVHAELDKFPREWLDFLDPQKVKMMYSIKAETLKIAHAYGEPILAKVTIMNTGNDDITIGPDGALRQDIWVDGQIKGIARQYLTGVAFERLGGKMLIKPKDTVTQTLRLDENQLGTLLAVNPTVELPLYFSVFTNPVTLTSAVVPGPGGYRVQFTKVVERGASPLNDQTLQGLSNQLVTGTADVRVRTIDLLGTFVDLMRKNPKDEVKNTAAQLAEMIHKSTGDSLPPARAEATYMTAILSEPTASEAMIRQMLADQSFAQHIYALLAIQNTLPPAKQKALISDLVPKDSDPIVLEMAQSVALVADMPATTQPTTQQAAQ